ncbi:hypothetical protein [Olivibacter sp. XZL3]|nr:hypothetical protein [Olivibacter sp. XZL3]
MSQLHCAPFDMTRYPSPSSRPNPDTSGERREQYDLDGSALTAYGLK